MASEITRYHIRSCFNFLLVSRLCMKAYASEIPSFHLGIFEGQCLRPSITDAIR